MKALCIVIFGILLSFISNAQTLPTPSFTNLPCSGYPGITSLIQVNPVAGATSYLWETNLNQINGLLLNGQISPVSSSTPAINLTFVLPQQTYQVCVTAISSCCTSATACITITGNNVISFSPANNQFASPGSTQVYEILPMCVVNNPMLYFWALTGNISFSNGLQQISTSTPNVPLTFGNPFGSGTLCVYSVNSFGIHSDTICMGIFNPGYTND